jgi:uncharacterized repeat protein (TIGR04138 family)
MAITIDLSLIAKHTRYPVEAFVFVQQGLDYTVKQLHGEMPEHMQGQPHDPRDHPERHVSGRQLCMGLRDYAIDQYGLLARPVLKRWGVRRSEDFGQIVFAMVEAGLMFKTDSDSLDDFRDVFDFAEAFSPSLSLSAAH